MKLQYKKKYQKNEKIRILSISGGFFISSIIENELRSLNIDLFTIKQTGFNIENFYRKFSDLIKNFDPDIIFTVNFHGFDKKGKFAALIKAVGIEVIVYLIDHPFYITDMIRNLSYNIFHIITIAKEWQAVLKEVYNLKSTYHPICYNKAISDYIINEDEKKYNFLFTGFTGLELISEIPGKNKPANTKALEEINNNFLQNPENLSELRELYKSNINDFILKAGYYFRKILYIDLKNKISILTKLKNYELVVAGDKYWNDILKDKPYQTYTLTSHKELHILYRQTKLLLHIPSTAAYNMINQKYLEAPFENCLLLLFNIENIEISKEISELCVICNNFEELKEKYKYYTNNECYRLKKLEEIKDIIEKKYSYSSLAKVIFGIIEEIIKKY